MPSVELKFAIVVENYDFTGPDHHYGPLFHKWIPDGETDALTLNTGDENVVLTVWFRRYGFVRDGFITFSYEKHEADPSVIERQAVLDAGPLFGRLILNDVTDEEMEALVQANEGDKAYINLGKRIINLIYPPVSRLIQVLRMNYGQYWLPELHKWDSRNETLGSYCSFLQLEWRADKESEWQEFLPNKSAASITLIIHPDEYYQTFLTKDDYFQLPKIIEQKNDTILSTIYLAISRAHQNHDLGALSYAIVEACTALELLMAYRFRNAYKESEIITQAQETFYNLPKEAQLVYLASVDGTLATKELEQAILAIKLRNDIVHKGIEPTSDKKTHDKINAILYVTTHFLAGTPWRFPSVNPGNKLFAEEKR